ncbi:hypothetical protein GWI34_19400 [Actinomadura sp. DSM 109109]|nr:hypothetical protein [Actinomadura lepetitiana]
MQAERLASEAVEVLATSVADPVTAGGAAGLHDLVRRWFLMNGQLAAFETFAADPRRDARVRELLRQAVEGDAAFARSLSAEVERTRPQSQNNSVHLDARGVRGGNFQVAGRNAYQNGGGAGGVPPLVLVFLIGLFLLAVVLLTLAVQR